MAVLAECPRCHKKQAIRNKLCSCDEDMVKAKRSNRVKYWISYRLPGPGGKQKFEKMKGEQSGSIDYARDADSKRRVQKRENTIFDIKPETNMTFKELTDWYLALESTKKLASYFQITNNLRKFNLEFGSRMVRDIKPSELDNYKVKREKEGEAHSTIDQEIGSAKTVINRAFDDDLVGGDTLKKFKKAKKYLTGKKRNSNARQRVLTPLESLKLLEKAPPHLKPILWTAYSTGMREGEILNLTWQKIFLKERVIKLKPEDTKDEEARQVPISEELYEILNRLPRGIQDDYPVFTYRRKPIKDIRAGLVVGCKEAGISYGRFKDDGFVFHDLRRTFVTDMRRAGVSESVIMEITGHSRGEVFDRYNQVSSEDMKEAVKELTKYRKAYFENHSANVYQTVYQVAFLGK